MHLPNFIRLLLGAILMTTNLALSHAAKGYVITAEIPSNSIFSYFSKPTKNVVYVSETALRMEAGDKASIFALRGHDVKFYKINHKEKKVVDSSALAPIFLMDFTFFVLDEGRDNERIDKNAVMPTGETRKVGKWTARKLIATSKGVPLSGWYTKDSPDLLATERMQTRLLAWAYEEIRMPNMPSAARRERLVVFTRSLVGYYERIRNDYGALAMSEPGPDGYHAGMTVVSVESRDISDSIFAVPAGYNLEMWRIER